MVSEVADDGVWYLLAMTRCSTKLTIENVHGEKGTKRDREVSVTVLC